MKVIEPIHTFSTRSRGNYSETQVEHDNSQDALSRVAGLEGNGNTDVEYTDLCQLYSAEEVNLAIKDLRQNDPLVRYRRIINLVSYKRSGVGSNFWMCREVSCKNEQYLYTEEGLVLHILRDHMHGIRPFRCQIEDCHESFYLHHQLSSHYQEKHNKPSSRQSDSHLALNVINNENENKKVQYMISKSNDSASSHEDQQNNRVKQLNGDNNFAAELDEGLPISNGDEEQMRGQRSIPEQVVNPEMVDDNLPPYSRASWMPTASSASITTPMSKVVRATNGKYYDCPHRSCNFRAEYPHIVRRHFIALHDKKQWKCPKCHKNYAWRPENNRRHHTHTHNILTAHLERLRNGFSISFDNSL